MNQHSFSLQRYSGASSRFVCPECGRKACFVRYVDENGKHLAENVGRCNHESSCGYHYTPREYFQDHPTNHNNRCEYRPKKPIPRPKPKPVPICTIPMEYVTRSVKFDRYSTLTKFLVTHFDPLIVKGLVDEYKLGVTKAGDVIYFQIDKEGRVRTGKVMKYDPTTGRRIRDVSNKGCFCWIHNTLKRQGILPASWQMTQCLFGVHLLTKYPDKKVGLVESEKTALICAAKMPQYIWLATGGKSQLNDRVRALAGREVVAFPDVDGYYDWKEKVREFGEVNIKVSDYLEKTATPQEREAHIDLADRLLAETARGDPDTFQITNPVMQQIAKYFSREYWPEVQALIEDFDLIPVSIRRTGT